MSELGIFKGQNKGLSGWCSPEERSALGERSGRGTSRRNLFLTCWEPVGLLGDESKTGTRSNFQSKRAAWMPVESGLEGSEEGSRATIRWSRQSG